MTTFQNITLIIAATTTALMAGLFFAWSYSITLGLARLSDEAYIAAMQAGNRAILNPVFYIVFFGTLLLLPLSTFLHYGQPVSLRFWLLLAATIVYLIGGFGVTIFGNIPLNEALDKFNLQAASEEAIAMQRAKFEGRWNSLNMIRTIASTIAVILVIMACLSRHKPALAE